MVYLKVDIYNPRKYTDVFYSYLIDNGYMHEEDAITNVWYWLSDDMVKEYALANFDVRFIESEEEEDEEDEDSEYVVL